MSKSQTFGEFQEVMQNLNTKEDDAAITAFDAVEEELDTISKDVLNSFEQDESISIAELTRRTVIRAKSVGQAFVIVAHLISYLEKQKAKKGMSLAALAEMLGAVSPHTCDDGCDCGD